MRDRSSINGLFLVIAISLVLGFLMLSGDRSLRDSAAYGTEGAFKLRELNILLQREP